VRVPVYDTRAQRARTLKGGVFARPTMRGAQDTSAVSPKQREKKPVNGLKTGKREK